MSTRTYRSDTQSDGTSGLMSAMPKADSENTLVRPNHANAQLNELLFSYKNNILVAQLQAVKFMIPWLLDMAAARSIKIIHISKQFFCDKIWSLY